MRHELLRAKLKRAKAGKRTRNLAGGATMLEIKLGRGDGNQI